jgi:hypothetical protein
MMRAISSMAHRLLFFGVAATKKERYRWVQKALLKPRYMLLNRAGRPDHPLSYEGHHLLSCANQAADTAVYDNGKVMPTLWRRLV